MVKDNKRIAIITGTTSGFGKAMAERFISAGYGVVGNGRRADKLAALEQVYGPAFRGIDGDAADASVVDRLFTTAVEHFGRAADIVVANAGRGLGGSVKDADLSEFDALMKINVTGALMLMQRAAREMVQHQEKRFPRAASDIVIVGSVVGRNISPYSAVYSASKFAVHALVEALRREIGPKGVRVSLIEPGLVMTGFQSAAGYSADMIKGLEDGFGPLPSATDIANAVFYSVSQPPNVHVCDIVVRPTRQDYP
jgi:NADP-dependent 3-hydroxy acid dehydrogenase YdfG